jgi:iron(III) transport system permease protein
LVNTLAVGLIIYLVVGPLIMLLWAAFQDASRGIRIVPPIEWSFINFERVFGDPQTYSHLVQTAVFAGGSLLLAFAISIGLAWLIERTDLPLRNVGYVLIVGALGIPNVVMVIAWTLMLNPTSGVINVTARTFWGWTSRRGRSISTRWPG